MSLPPSPSLSQLQEEADLLNTASTQPLDTQDDPMPSPTPDANLASMDNTQTDRMPSPTPHSAQAVPTTTHTQPQSESDMSQPPDLLLPHPPPSPAPSSKAAPRPLAPTDPKQNTSTMPQTTEPQPTIAQPDPQSTHPSTPHQASTPPSPFDPTLPLPPYDWDDLASRFEAKMAECAKVEEGIEREWEDLVAVSSLLSHLHAAPSC